MSEYRTAPAPASAPATRATLLVGDSEPLFAEALGRALARRLDVEVLKTHPHTGTDAAQAAIVFQPDVVVLDLWLEGISGPAVTRSILAKGPATRVVMLGWLHSADDLAAALHAGASSFVSKVMGLGDLVDAIGYVLSGRPVVIDPYYRVTTSPAAACHRVNGDNQRSAPVLSVRELEVLRLLGAGLLIEDIAERLAITHKTAETHITRILARTDTHSQLQAVAVARRHGYFD